MLIFAYYARLSDCAHHNILIFTASKKKFSSPPNFPFSQHGKGCMGACGRPSGGLDSHVSRKYKTFKHTREIQLVLSEAISARLTAAACGQPSGGRGRAPKKKPRHHRGFSHCFASRNLYQHHGMFCESIAQLFRFIPLKRRAVLNA